MICFNLIRSKNELVTSIFITWKIHRSVWIKLYLNFVSLYFVYLEEKEKLQNVYSL